MNIKALRKHFASSGLAVRRDRRQRETTVEGGGLTYRFDERQFKTEAELAELARSKMPTARLVPNIPS